MRWVSERRFLHFIEDIKGLFAYKKDIPTKLSQLENDCNFGGVSEDVIKDAVENYLDKNDISVDTDKIVTDVLNALPQWQGGAF